MFSKLRDKDTPVTEKFEYLSASNFGESHHKNYINPESEILTWLLNQPITSPSFNLITELLSKFPSLQNTYQSHSIKSQTLSSIAKLDRVTDQQLSTFFKTNAIIRVGGGWPRWLTDGSKKLRKNFFGPGEAGDEKIVK